MPAGRNLCKPPKDGGGKNKEGDESLLQAVSACGKARDEWLIWIKKQAAVGKIAENPVFFSGRMTNSKRGGIMDADEAVCLKYQI